jgi:hypothetical protein
VRGRLRSRRRHGHEWLAITAPNGEQGYQCQRCRLTAIYPVRSSCPPKLIPTLAELLRKTRMQQPVEHVGGVPRPRIDKPEQEA